MKKIKKRLWITIIAAIFMAVFISSCKDENVGTVGVCPAVISTNPANNANGVPLNQTITITFNEKMNRATITQASFTLQDPGKKKSSTAEISGALTYDETNATISFVPSTVLASNVTYTGRVASSIKDLMGNALQTEYVWTFTTGTTLSSTVISTDPADSATGVVLNKRVTATFNEPMNPLTLTTTTFTLTQGVTSVAGAVTCTGTTAYFKPTSALLPNTIYTGTITTGAMNVAGTILAKNYVWTFTTGTTAAPTVNSTDPVNLTTNVALNKVISVTFSETMDTLTITASTFTLMIGTTLVSGTIKYSGATVTFTPTSNLISGTYTATITNEAKNPAGISMTNNYIWSFSTNATIGVSGVDLKSVARFGIIAGVGVSNNAGPSIINDLDVGIYPGVRSSITGFPPATIVGGAMYASDDIAPPGVPAMLNQAKLDLVAAYLFAEGATSPAPATVSGDQGGTTLVPGIYKSTSTLLIQSGDLTLDAKGDANAVWIFQVASDFTTVGGAGGNVILTGNAQAKNVFWQVGRSATIGDYTTFYGNILALTSITMNSHATATGRMLARNGSVVLTSTNTINKP
jgi:methionine-rich copper-binding protein CopC